MRCRPWNAASYCAAENVFQRAGATGSRKPIFVLISFATAFQDSKSILGLAFGSESVSWGCGGWVDGAVNQCALSFVSTSCDSTIATDANVKWTLDHWRGSVSCLAICAMRPPQSSARVDASRCLMRFSFEGFLENAAPPLQSWWSLPPNCYCELGWRSRHVSLSVISSPLTSCVCRTTECSCGLGPGNPVHDNASSAGKKQNIRKT